MFEAIVSGCTVIMRNRWDGEITVWTYSTPGMAEAVAAASTKDVYHVDR